MRRLAFAKSRFRGSVRGIAGAKREAVVVIDGPLDAETGEVLREVVGLACEDRGGDRVVEVNLQNAERVTTHGVNALRECARIGEAYGCEVRIRLRKEG